MLQSFEIFNVYGKPPEAAGSIVQGFDMILEQYAIEEITLAFKDWMRTSSTMPTPADILRIVKENLEHRRAMQGERARPAREYQEIRPPWIIEIFSGNGLKPETALAMRDFLLDVGEQVGRTYCENLCKYDDIIALKGIAPQTTWALI